MSIGRAAAWLGVSLLCLACASAPTRPAVSGGAGVEAGAPPAAFAVPTDGSGYRAQLFRLTFDGPEGRVTARAVLRESRDGSRFQLALSDLAGRRWLSLDLADGEALWVDHRERLFCRTDAQSLLVEIHPAEVEFSVLPRILRGEVPIAELGLSPETPQAVDASGRTWRSFWEGGRLERWTLIERGEPTVWWTRQTDGGILSRRSGEQYRWSLGASEETETPLPDLLPSGYVEGVCETADAP